MIDPRDEIRDIARSIAITCHLLGGEAGIVAHRPAMAPGLVDACLTALAQLAEDTGRLVRSGAIPGAVSGFAAVPQQRPPTSSEATDAAEIAK